MVISPQGGVVLLVLLVFETEAENAPPARAAMERVCQCMLDIFEAC